MGISEYPSRLIQKDGANGVINGIASFRPFPVRVDIQPFGDKLVDTRPQPFIFEQLIQEGKGSAQYPSMIGSMNSSGQKAGNRLLQK
ncbi:hypothetical protein D3C72_2209070 [compost metagenome]